MRVVIQRVSKASVAIENKICSKINYGLLILLGIEVDDNQDDALWLANKVARIRIFLDEDGKMNNSILDVDGDVLVVSQFTLHAQTKKGNRPSYINAAKGEKAKDIYNNFLLEFKNQHGVTPKTGKFGADMKVELENNGPVTILIDTKNKL